MSSVPGVGALCDVWTARAARIDGVAIVSRSSPTAMEADDREERPVADVNTPHGHVRAQARVEGNTEPTRSYHGITYQSS
jgi:hypothetical protein